MNRQRITDLLNRLSIKLFPTQAEVFWAAAKNTLLVGGEGSSKSFIGGLLAVCRSLTDPGTHLGWLVGDDFEDARKEMDYVIEWAEMLGALDRDSSTISTHSDQKCKVYLRAPATLYEPAINVIIETVSAHDPLKIGREEPDFIVGCEISRWEAEVWHRCQGRLARRPNSWAFFSGSPEPTAFGWFHEVATLGEGPNTVGLKTFRIPSWANPYVYPGGAEDPKIVALRSSMSTERFNARHGATSTMPRDAVLPEFKASVHVYPVAHEEGWPTYVFIDPGTRICAVEFVQIVGEEVHVVDEVYLARASHEQVIQSTVNKRDWAYVREGIIDVAAHQEHFGQGTPEQAWYRDTGLRLRAQYHKVSVTVERLRSALSMNPVTQRPRLLINPKCKGLIAELGGGPPPVDGTGLWKMQGGTPKAENDHACKALGYGLLALFGTVRPYSVDEEEGEEDDASYLTSPVSANRTLEELLRR